MTVLRFDRSELKRPTRTREGWMRADGYLTRVGVFEYRLGNGEVRRELRPPEEVFHADALASFSLAPITREHPKGAVTSENWRDLAVGTVGENVQKEGDLVRAALLFTDSQTIGDLERGDRRELSCGYTCDLEDKPGEHNGQAYDCIQRNIRGNHVALVSKGRAGPQVAVRLDAADGLDASLSPTDDAPARGRNEGAVPVVKVTIAGVQYDVSEQAKQALEVQEKERTDAEAKGGESLKVAIATAEKEKGRADALDAKLKELEKAKADAEDPKRLQALITARVALVSAAAPVLGDKVKLDAMSDAGIKAAVCEKLIPNWKADGKSEAAIEGAYETALALAGKARPTTPVQGARGVVQPPPGAKADSGADDVVTAARERMKADGASAWKPKAA